MLVELGEYSNEILIFRIQVRLLINIEIRMPAKCIFYVGSFLLKGVANIVWCLLPPPKRLRLLPSSKLVESFRSYLQDIRHPKNQQLKINDQHLESRN